MWGCAEVHGVECHSVTQGQNLQSDRSSLSVVTQWTHSEQGITAHMSECMCVSFLPKEHDITKASHGDVVVKLAAGHGVIIKEV